MYPIIALVSIAVLTWAIAIWATYEDSEGTHDAQQPERLSDKDDHRKAA